MKRGVFLLAVALVLAGIGAGSVAYAQDVTIVTMPFKFSVANKVMAPGKYEVRLSEDRMVISVVPERGQGVVLPTVTRLALQQPIKDGRLVFDKVGEQYVLSEVWLPDQDGFLVKDTKEPHQHHIVNGEKKGT